MDDDPDYKIYTVDDEHSFVTSKFKGDNLPLTSFKVEKKPCLDPTEVSTDTQQRYYPLENDRRRKDCSTIEQYSEKYDTRYRDLGLTISEYEVQKESKVLKKLEELPNFTLYSTELAKQGVNYKFWSRPTISWKLNCDDQHSRMSVMKAADTESEKADLHVGTIIALTATSFSIGALVSFIFMVCFCGGCCK